MTRFLVRDGCPFKVGLTMPTTFTWAIASVSCTFIQTLPKWRLTTNCKPICLSLLLASQPCVFWEAFSSCRLEIKSLLLLFAAAVRETSVPSVVSQAAGQPRTHAHSQSSGNLLSLDLGAGEHPFKGKQRGWFYANPLYCTHLSKARAGSDPLALLSNNYGEQRFSPSSLARGSFSFKSYVVL